LSFELFLGIKLKGKFFKIKFKIYFLIKIMFFYEMKVNINILFWDNGDEQRYKNTTLSWHLLKDFAEFAKQFNLVVIPNLFDFSEEKKIEDAIHITYPKGTFKKAEKINKVIEHFKDFDGFFSIMDSDIIIRPSDYQNLVDLIKSFKQNKYYVFNLDDLTCLSGVDFLGKKINFNALQYKKRVLDPDLGALFFIHQTIINNFKMDERFVVWGGEDNEVSYRLQNAGYKKVICPFNVIHLPHNHALKKEDMQQYNEQVNILRQNKK
jgi:hypothetical protein